MFECDCDCESVEGFLKGVHKAHCRSHDAIYPEICVDRGESPFLPESCPACGAEAEKRGNNTVTYACGGSYRPKPQIQNHTDKWWGSCKVDKPVPA